MNQSPQNNPPNDITSNEKRFERLRELVDKIKNNLEQVIVGKPQVIDLVLVGLLGGGHILLEDVPGVGKTTLAKALAKSLDLKFSRIQFTPDLLPADILGGSIYNPQTGEFYFRHGPIFANIILADEINRASPRTQSALLEAMTEFQATIEGETRAIPQPFLVIATQNPIEFHGTYPLPEAQLDRFMLRISLGYPQFEDECNILYFQQITHPLDDLKPVANMEALNELMYFIKNITVDPSVVQYIVHIIQKTREHSQFRLGGSPRASFMLFRASQARAFLHGRTWVLPDDVKEMVYPVLLHRLILNTRVQSPRETKETVLREIIEDIPVPR